ncbi:SPOR domain-containing protein [Thalassotalea ganghwensis]
MSTPFQNRLVGTVIVAALAIIFLPDILDGEKQTYQEEFDKIPSPPSAKFSSSTPTFDESKLVKLADEDVVDEAALDDDENYRNDADAEQDVGSLNDSNTEHVSETLKVSALAKEQFIESSPADDDVIVESEKQTSPSLPEKAVVEEAWVIQLGSFRHQKNVDDLLAKLKANGYTAYSRPIKTRKGTLTKVFVGPELIKSSLEKKIQPLKKLTNVEGKIARFRPTS